MGNETSTELEDGLLIGYSREAMRQGMTVATLLQVVAPNETSDDARSVRAASMAEMLWTA